MSLRGKLGLWAATAATALALIAPVPASADGAKAMWGPTKLPGGASAFAAYEELGVDVFQYQVDWAAVAPVEPANPANPADSAYRWSSGVDYAIQQAAAHGMDVALLVKGTPWWAVNGAAQGANVRTQAPSNVQDYADFLRAASARYPTVHRWMIWGEANRAAVWSSGPIAYADLLDAAYGALKPLPGDPDVVVGGMTFTFGEIAPRDWISGMVRSNGARPGLDEYGHNPFSRRCPDLDWGPNYLADGARDISDIDTLAAETKAAFGAATKLWLSEFTVSSDRANRAMTFFVSRPEQADWVTKAYALAGSVDYVSGLGWFNLHDEPAGDPLGLTTGLMTYEGQEKPAYSAYRDARLDGSMPVVPCNGSAAAPPSPAGEGAGGGGADHTPPALRISAKPKIALSSLLKGGYPLQVGCDERCTVKAVLLLAAKEARRRGLGALVRVGTARTSLPTAGVKRVKVRLTRRAAKKLRGAHRLKLTLRLTATDAAGNSTRREVKLRARG